MLTCVTKTGRGWKTTCGNKASAVLIMDSHGEPTAYPTCTEHAPADAPVTDLTDFTPDAFRTWCAQNGLTSAI
jgi:hypothetical protein